MTDSLATPEMNDPPKRPPGRPKGAKNSPEANAKLRAHRRRLKAEKLAGLHSPDANKSYYMHGKKTNYMAEAWKERIQVGNLMGRLHAHAEGILDMSSTQIKAADILLRKVIPDVARSEVTGADGKDLIPNLSEAELEARIKSITEQLQAES